MTVLNLNCLQYALHANNIAQIIVASKYRDDAEKMVDLYLQVVNGAAATEKEKKCALST